MTSQHTDLNTLPSSQLLRLAVWDCLAVESGRELTNGLPVDLRMDLWLGIINDTECVACMAGAVLLERNGWDFDAAEYQARSQPTWMLRIDDMRMGFVASGDYPSEKGEEGGLFELSHKWEKCYHALPTGENRLSWREYSQFADELEALGR